MGNGLIAVENVVTPDPLPEVEVGLVRRNLSRRGRDWHHRSIGENNPAFAYSDAHFAGHNWVDRVGVTHHLGAINGDRDPRPVGADGHAVILFRLKRERFHANDSAFGLPKLDLLVGGRKTDEIVAIRPKVANSQADVRAHSLAAPLVIDEDIVLAGPHPIERSWIENPKAGLERVVLPLGLARNGKAPEVQAVNVVVGVGVVDETARLRSGNFLSSRAVALETRIGCLPIAVEIRKSCRVFLRSGSL